MAGCTLGESPGVGAVMFITKASRAMSACECVCAHTFIARKGKLCVCMCVCVCMRKGVRVCARVCVHECTCVCVCVCVCMCVCGGN